MNQKRRLIVKDVHKTTAEKVSVPFLPQSLRIVLKSAMGMYRRRKGADPAPVSKRRDKSVMTLKPDKDIIAEISISDFLFLGCLS
ncbi:MAG: hypothetical protein ACYS80_24520 [Planctomycetota bacterium]|jgi:hypothetical protein